MHAVFSQKNRSEEALKHLSVALFSFFLAREKMGLEVRSGMRSHQSAYYCHCRLKNLLIAFMLYYFQYCKVLAILESQAQVFKTVDIQCFNAVLYFTLVPLGMHQPPSSADKNINLYKTLFSARRRNLSTDRNKLRTKV